VTTPRPRSNRWWNLAPVTIIVAAATLSVTGNAVAENAGEPTNPGAPKSETSETSDTLGAHDLDLLATAEAKGEQQVTLIVAAENGQTAKVAGDLAAIGGTIGKQVDSLGYLRVQVPTAAVIKASNLPGVAAVDLNESIPLPDPTPQAAAGVAALALAPQAGPGPSTPADNPFMPAGETGAVAFRQANPAWDGRGVTIGIMDSGVDLDNPALQTTTTGERKIVDWFTATDPITEGDETWRAMLDTVTGPNFTIAGGTWTAPAGTYLFNTFNESITTASEIGGDVNRDGDVTDRYGILYDSVTNNIWVDVNQNLNFTDDALMRPYAEKFDIGHFGTDNPATEVRDQIPFVVEFRQDVSLTLAGLEGTADFVNIGIIEDRHGSHVAGITAANDMLGNANLDGAAPGAKLVSARACSWGGGCTAVALSEGMIELVANRHVDVVNMSIGGLPALNDGNNARARLYNNLISTYGVQLFISAGNSGPGLNTIGDPAVASDVVSVAAGISKETWLSNYGSVVRKAYGVLPFSSRGPAENGAFNPDITAPGAAISTVQLWQPGGPVAEAGYGLPPGYAMLQGTSMASPQAAGAAALLLSAAKATDRGVTPAALRRAIYSSGSAINGVSVIAQGNGKFNVQGAWRLLSASLDVRTYTSDAPVCTPISDLLATPNRGPGIYNRCAAGAGGVLAGKAETYPVTLTRTSGPARGIRHQLNWVGNDGTFSSAGSVVLPLNTPIQVSVRVRAGIGQHSAILQVNDPATPMVDFEVMNAVVISAAFAEPGYALATGGSIDRNSTTSFFVTVPEDTPALQVNLSGIATGSQTRFIAINPYGVPVENTATTACYTNYSDPAACKPQERSYENPLPGVWEFEVEARRTSPSLNNPFRLAAELQGVTVDPAIVNLPSVEVGVPTPVNWTLTNRFGPVTVQGQGGPLGSAAVSQESIGNGVSQQYTVNVPAGASRLDASIGNPSDLGADLDLYVYRNGVLVGQSADGDSEEAVSLPNPVAGSYVVRVDGYSVPAGTTTYDYRDVFYASALGNLSAPASPTMLPAAGTATIAGSVTALSAPAAGRQLFGELQLVTDEGALVGRGQVLIGAVTD